MLWPFEKWCKDQLEAKGWFVAQNTGKGMPDFICWHPLGEFKMVECKLDTNDLTGDQAVTFASLCQSGVRIEIYKGAKKADSFAGILVPWFGRSMKPDAESNACVNPRYIPSRSFWS